MKSLVGKFTFKVPDEYEGADAGKKIEKAFDYKECETDVEAQAVIVEKKWKLLDMVNENLKANARSNAYQAALLPFKPTNIPVEEIAERLIRDFIRAGLSEEMARAQVTSMLASAAEAKAAASSETASENPGA
jgi:hypothetical protein